MRAREAKLPDVELIAGNVATAEATEALIDAGADAVKVGIGPGSICTTRVVAGVGVPQITAIADCARAADGHGIPVIADGGIKYSGDVAKAHRGGRDTVMIGSLFAGTDEAPGDLVLVPGPQLQGVSRHGLARRHEAAAPRTATARAASRREARARGHRGARALQGAAARPILYQLVGGLRSGMGYSGCAHDRRAAEQRALRADHVAGLRESHVHDVIDHRRSAELPAVVSTGPVLALDLGGQYAQLIARRVREAGVYSELVGHRVSASEAGLRKPTALILSGGPPPSTRRTLPRSTGRSSSWACRPWASATGRS